MEKFEGNDLLEPVELYQTRLKDAFHNNADNYYQEMTDKAKTNVPANQGFCKIYYEEMEKVRKLRKQKALRIFLVVLSIIASIAAFIAGVVFIKKQADEGFQNGILFGILLLLAGVALVVAVVFLIMKIVKLKQEIEERLARAEKAKEDAYNEMKSLLHLYEWNMAASLMTKTTPLLQLDSTFDGEKYQFLHEKYGYNEYKGNDISTVFVQSGSILGNPFVFEKNYVQTMRDHTYSGSITITWTERVYDGNGKSHTEFRSQVLTAYHTAPEPCYYLDTWLIYGNEAAPNLSFSRYPTDINGKSDKQIESYVKKMDKKLDKKVEKSMQKGDGSFTRMDNAEFDALFNALDRDNELEFRLLFTPLAQKNMIRLLKDEDAGFGDDFIFKKRKKLNYIKSEHQQRSDSLDKNPASLFHFDYKEARKMFVDYCDKYLKDVYFDLAPLISIPLYQQYKTIEYIYEGKFNHNVTQAEAESAANSHDVNYFKHPETRSTGVILKSDFASKAGDADVCNITAHSFRGVDRVELVPMMGGDGKMHTVPVNWIEYFPISRVTQMLVKDTHQNKSEYEENYSSNNYSDLISKFGATSDIIYKKRII